MTHPHRTVLKQTASQNEPSGVSRKDHLVPWYNRVGTTTGGLKLWNATASCDVSSISASLLQWMVLPLDRRLHGRPDLAPLPLSGPIKPYGAEVQYQPISDKDKERIHKYRHKLLSGILMGYAQHTGGGRTGDLFIADWEEVPKR